MSRGQRRAPLVVPLCLVMVLIAATASAQPFDRSRLRPVPAVALDFMEPAVREQLEIGRERLDTVLERPEVGAGEAANAFGELGALYLVYDLTNAAAPCLANAAELAPESFRWAYLLGGVYQHDRRLEDAIVVLERALGLEPDDAAALIRLARAQLDLERPDLARPLFERALSVPGAAAAAHFGLGQIAFAAGDFVEARRQYEAALALQPEASALHYHLGLAHRGLGDREAMQRHFDQRGDQEVRFRDPLALQLQADATGVGALLMLGRISVEIGAYDVAEERFRRAVALGPTSAAAHRSLGAVLERLGRADEAIAEYSQALRLEPENANLAFSLGLMLAGHGRDEEAVERFRASLGYAPDFEPTWLELAAALERLGRVEEALEVLEEAGDQLPSAVVQRTRARLLEGRGRLLQAVDILAATVAAYPDAPAALLQLALLEQRLRRNDAAQRHLVELLESEAPRSLQALAHFHLANLLVGDDELDSAIEHYRQAVALEPELAEPHFNLATLLGRTGAYAEAAEHHARVVELDSDNSEARLGEAMALILAGNHVAARARLETARIEQPIVPAFWLLLAQLLVASPDDDVRDGAAGLELATDLFGLHPSLEHGETLAMALAEVGRFEEAMHWQRQVVEQLERSGNQARADVAKERLESYQRGEPVRSPWR